jgi:protein involved in polysaccharide export with SLBB domain
MPNDVTQTPGQSKGQQMMSNWLKRAVFLSAILLLGTYQSDAQSAEQVKQQAESKLRQMTPDEIEQALKEYGITIDEGIKRAQALGISLQDYLSKAKMAGVEKEETQVDPRLFWQMTAVKSARTDTGSKRLEQLLAPVRSVVPGFHGRRGVDSLVQPFGYSLFEYPSSTFLPSVSVATPPSYVLGAGDEVVVTVWGETQLNYKLQVNRDGNLQVPDVGPVLAQGLSIQQFRENLVRRMSKVYSSLAGGSGKARTFLDVSLGRLKTIQVLVMGEVQKPGGYAVSSMSTVLHALYLAGGPTVEGTLRNVAVMRKGETVAGIDLYSYILEGNRSADVPLLDGDIVFVKPVARRAAVVGRVLRPGIYELRDGEHMGDLVKLAGGPRFDAYVDRVHVERVVPFAQRHQYDRDILDFDVQFDGQPALLASKQNVENGDVVTVYTMQSRYQNRVVIDGSVNKPGPFQLQPGMRIVDLIKAADSLRLSTFSERGTLFRTLPNLRKEVIGFNPRLALAGDSIQNLLLHNEDSVVVYSDAQFNPRHTVRVFGAVRTPGEYARHEGMNVADLVVMAGGLAEGASLTGWELSRLDSTSVKNYTRLIKLDSQHDYWTDVNEPMRRLEDFDVLFVPFNPRFNEQRFVRIGGFVMFPGIYSIRSEGERLADIFKRAGGLRPGAYLEGSRLIRKFNNAGLVPINFRQAIDNPASRDNVVVYDGDSVHVAYTEDVVYVNGEVYVPSPVLFEDGEGLSYYIEQAGGYKEEAEKSNTVVFLPGGKKWEKGDILPGSTIFVPKKIEKPDTTLPIIRDLATILASLAAITVALIQVTK